MDQTLKPDATTDTSKDVTGEDVIQRIIHEVVTLQQGHNQLVIAYEQMSARADQQDEKIALLTRLLDSHQANFEILKIREQGGRVQ